jgi:hypothetical protein
MKINIHFHEDQYTLLITSRSFLLGIENVSSRIVEKIITFYAQ